MKRSFTFLIAAFALLVSLALPLGVWGQNKTTGDVLNETFEATSSTVASWSLNAVSGHVNGYAQIDAGSAMNGSKGLHLGSSGNAFGSATTPTLSGMTSNATMTFWAKTNTNNHSLKLSATGCTIDQTSIVIANGTWTQYTVNITNGTSSAKINFYKDGTTKKYIYIDDVVITSVSAVSYNITANSNNTSWGTVSLTGTVITATPATGYRVSTTTPYEVTSGTATVTQNGNTFNVNATSDCTVQINFEAIPTHTVTLPANDSYGTYTMNATNPVAYGTTVTLTYTPAEGYEAYTATWTVNGETISGNSFTMPDENVTVTVSVAVSTDVTDVLTYSLIGITGTSYQNWTGKTSNSDAVYAGQSSGGNSSIQLRATSPSGIVTTTTGGKVKKVVVVWNSNTANGRTIDIYGKDSAYSSAGDLYNNSNQGTKLGSIVYGSSTELIVSGDYAYVGIRSNSNSLNLDEIRITWEKVVLTPHNITINSMTNGTVEADKASATQGAIITLTATPDSDYYLYNINATPTDGLTIHTDGTFTFAMPDENVNVNATFNQVSPMTVTEALAASLPLDPFHYVCVTGVVTGFYGNNTDITTDTYHRYYIAVDDASENQLLVYNGTGLNHAAFSDANDLRVGDQVVVWGELIDYTSGGNTIREIAKGNYIVSLERPVVTEYYQYSVNGVEGDIIETTSGTEITLPSTVETVPTGFTFAGWTTNANDVEHFFAAGSLYTINETVEFFAVFSKNVSELYSFSITKDDFNGASYNANTGGTSTATSTTGSTMDVTWVSSNVMLQGGVMQWRNNQGYIYNTTDLGTITEVNITESEGNEGVFTTIIGSTSQPTENETGGYFKTSVSGLGKTDNMTISFIKEIARYYTRIYTKDITANTWYFIASPTGTAPTNINDLGDLYYYDEQNHFWRNKKQHDTGFDFGYGKGYLCANETAAVQLSFTGTLLANDTYSVPVTYNATTSENGSNSLAGWNLVGNPFNSNATLDVDCFILNGSSINTTAQTAGYVIAPFAGVMVKASATGSVLFTKVTENAPAPQPNQVQIVVEQKVLSRGVASTSVHDNAIINFNEGSQLEKFSFNPDAAKLYIPQNGKEYAIYSAQAQGEMPVNFKASTDGEYTITVSTEGVEMNYLHLIDNMTGMDVDLLQTPNYTFDATTSDYESRFRLVFAGASTSSATDETFAYYDGSEWQVSNEGEATLQVVDVMGRIVSTETVNGNFNLNLNQTAGVYMLRLINSNGVKTQKIVVR